MINISENAIKQIQSIRESEQALDGGGTNGRIIPLYLRVT
jgi:hypothetical protein